MKRYDMEALLKEVLSQCMELKIPVSDRIIPEPVINRRAKSRFGSCRKVWKDSSGKYIRRPESSLQQHYFQIEICEPVLDADEKDIKNILAHELLHTCYGCYNHGKRWKAYAAKMNEVYGYNITATSTYEKMGLDSPEKNEAYKYKIECRKCGKMFYRRKKSKLIKDIKRYRCQCGGKLECTEIGKK